MALETGLLANYEFEGNSNDNSGNGNNGTDASMAYSTGNGFYLQGAGFNGSSSTFSVGGITITTNVTFNLWVKFASNPGGTAFFCNSASGATFYMGADGKFHMSKSGVQEFGASNSAMSTNTWQMISGTYDGATVTYYLNGSSNGGGSYSQTFTSAIRWFGADSTPANLFTGSLDSFSIWNTVKTGTEISTLYNGGVGMHFNGSIFVPNVVGGGFLFNFI